MARAYALISGGPPVVAPPTEKPVKKMATVEPVHEIIDRPTNDLHHGGVTEAQNQVAEDVPSSQARLKKAQGGDALPARDDLKGVISKLYEVSRIKGLTPQGWKALETQMGGLSPGSAAKFLTPMSSISEEKVANLNAGKSTTGEALG